jgi:protease-4
MADVESPADHPTPEPPPGTPERAAQQPPARPDAGETGPWERELLTRLAFASLLEQRRARRWGLAFRGALLVYLTVLLVLYTPGEWWSSTGEGRHTALVDVRGIIRDGGEASADRIVAGLRAAFEDDDTAAVILRINSPGGSPVQAAYVNEEIRRLRGEHPDKPLYAVISDMAASGGYYLAVAADRIYANQSSIVGSIGVLMNGFGFVDAMDKLGIERRLLTAGEHKGLLDPFSPSRELEVNHIETMLEGIHAQFIDAVKQGRGDRLAADDRLFTGLVWTGEESVGLGLVDEIASAGQIARDVVGAEEIIDFTLRRSYLDRLAGKIGSQLAEGALQALIAERLTLR